RCMFQYTCHLMLHPGIEPLLAGLRDKTAKSVQELINQCTVIRLSQRDKLPEIAIRFDRLHDLFGLPRVCCLRISGKFIAKKCHKLTHQNLFSVQIRLGWTYLTINDREWIVELREVLSPALHKRNN